MMIVDDVILHKCASPSIIVLIGLLSALIDVDEQYRYPEYQDTC